MGLDDRGVERGAKQSWMDRKLGYIQDPKRKTGQFYNNVLKGLYDSYWPYCGSATIFREAFIKERHRQYTLHSKIENLHRQVTYLTSENTACAGKYIKENYIPSPHDIENLQRLSESASKIKDEVEQEINNLKKEDDSLFCSNGKLTSGREFNHSFNEDTTFKMKTFIMDIIDPFLTKITDHKEKKKQVTWKNRGKKRTNQQRDRENKAKVDKRVKKRKRERCKQIFLHLGGIVWADEYYEPSMGATQITDFVEEDNEDKLDDIESILPSKFSDYDRLCLADLVLEGCFQGPALDIIEEYLLQYCIVVS
ncbi:unnamed protein product [Mytilus coruscus]|uniref:Uncharacterized protein n=1 Tax=Mytilus coruscus TaxID=42192 RepID=A0A6J8BK99_MYTCO|nr:unnamed protein product [Mytilus coruscus]